MILLHVDDFIMAGKKLFVEDTVKMFEKSLKISKVEEEAFRFCGVNL